jgi:transposase InsO family protein
MNDDRRVEVALFRLAVLGDLIHAKRSHGVLSRSLRQKSQQVWQCPDGPSKRLTAKTIESWYYRFQKDGFDGLKPRDRRDRGLSRAISAELQRLVVEMKREDPGRSIPLIIRELESNGRVKKGELRETTVGRLLRREGLSGPKMEMKTPARYRFVAATCGELWQGDACHGPKLFDPGSGREVRVKIFGLIDDKSRLLSYLRAGFHERQEDVLKVLLEAVRRRGIPRALLLDNHGSFTGTNVRVACAKLGIRLVFARPYDGASKGKIERFWRTLRAHVLDRLDPEKVVTLDDLNVRLMTYVENDYNQRPHAGLSGKTPRSVWEEDATEIRWVDDPTSIDSAFLHSFQRKCQ